MSKRFFYPGSLIVFIISCTPQLRVVESWASSNEFSNADYDDAWSVVVSTITEEFDLETIDGASGYLKTTWKKLPPGCATGYGAFGEEGVRATVRVDSRQPFRIKIRVEKGNYTDGVWSITGIDKEWTNRLLETINGRLQKYK